MTPHNVDPSYVSEVEPDNFRVKFSAEGYEYVWSLAKARVQAKIDNGAFNRRFTRGVSEADAIAKAQADYYSSIQGEAAFAVLYDLPLDWHTLTHGDPGWDFKTANDMRFDVKTTTYPTGVLNLHNQEYINTISVKTWVKKLALVLAIRPVDASKGRTWIREQWISIAGWLPWVTAVEKAVHGEKGGSPMIYVEQKELWKPSDLKGVIGVTE